MTRPAAIAAARGAGPAGVGVATLLAAAVFALAVGVLGARGLARLNVPGAPDAEHWAFADFRDAVYYPVVAVLDGGNPYDRRAYRETYPIGTEFPLYSPHTLLVHLPFGLLPYGPAQALYALVTIGLTLLLGALALDAAGVRRTAAAVLLVGAALLLARPGQMNLLLGQVTATVAVASWLALRWADARPGLAAVALAVSLLKPTFGVPLTLLLAAAGAWRVAVGGAALAAAASLAAVGWIVVNAGGPVPFAAAVLENLGSFESGALVDPATSPYRIDAPATLGRLLGWTPRAAQLPLGLAILGVAGLTLARLRRRGGDGVVGPALACVAVLACAYHQAYDLLLLVPSAAALAAGRGAVGPVARVALVALFVLPMVNFLATDTAIRSLGLAGGAWVLATSINGCALVAALALCLGVARREAR